MKKPKVSEIKNWIQNPFISYSSVVIYQAEENEDFFKVESKGFKTKYFYGETAWQDAERYASDIYFQKQYA